MRAGQKHRSQSGGFSLVIVLTLTAVSFLTIATLLSLIGSSGSIGQRRIEYERGLAAAEAATEKVIASLTQDFHTGGADLVASRLGAYGTMIPNDLPEWGDYVFEDPHGAPNSVWVDEVRGWDWSSLAGPLTGLSGSNAVYRIIANARVAESANVVTAGLLREVQISAVPLFAFGMFYNLDMEFYPWHDWPVTGRVHSNGDSYFRPRGEGVDLLFTDSVTCAQRVHHASDGAEGASEDPGHVGYQRELETRCGALFLPGLSVNNATNGRVLIEPPPGGESAGALPGLLRYYNQADLIVRVLDDDVWVTSGVGDGMSVRFPTNVWQSFVGTNNTFYDWREEAQVSAVDLDLAGLGASSEVVAGIGHAPKVIYVMNLRTASPGVLPAVRLVNGAAVPFSGVTVATPYPLYIMGPYNTVDTAPAAVAADAVTLLSSAWTDARSGEPLGVRVAESTTFNLAVICGLTIPDSGGATGGVLNSLRLLEDWTGQTLHFRGSLVVMFRSEHAQADWSLGIGKAYRPPHREFVYETAFLDPTMLPPRSPFVFTVSRTRWETIPAGTIP